MVRIDLDQPAEEGRGLLQTLEIEQQPRALLCRLRVARVELEHAIPRLQRVLKTLLLPQNLAEREPRRNEIRPEFQRNVETRQRFIEARAMRQQPAEIEKIIGIGLLDADRLHDEVDRRIELACLCRYETAQMQCIRMPRIGRQEPLAGLLRLIQPPLAEMLQRCRQQRLRRFLRDASSRCEGHAHRAI